MSVIYIGDRETGKTSLAMELANSNTHYVKVSSPDYETLKQLLYDEDAGRTRATDAVQSTYDRTLEIQVTLPARTKEISLQWIDTPGEIWRSSWQKSNPAEWQNFLDRLREMQGILLVVPPYREILLPNTGVDPSEFITQQQWCNRFDRWAQFFHKDCPNIKHLIICMNKADLVCDIDREAAKLGYHPTRSRMNWTQRNNLICQKYFSPVRDRMTKINQSISGLSVRYFITSIYNRALLELPWIYLGTYLKS